MLSEVIFLATSLIAFILGLVIFLRPRETVDMQIHFYALINWRLEPISWGRELRNTRLMGVFLMVTVIGIILFVGTNGW
jgi:hypothetical protein